MTGPVVVHPLGLVVVQAALLTVAEVTDIIDDRISDVMTRPFPSIRTTELTTVEWVPLVWTRGTFQFECWADDQPDADRLGRRVLGALRSLVNHVSAEAVIGNVDDLAVRAQADKSLTTPAQPRSIVTGHVWIRPN